MPESVSSSGSDLTEDPPAAVAPETSFQAQVRAARFDLENKVASRVTNARADLEEANERLKEANERIKERTGRDLIVATAIGIAIGAVVIACLLFVKWIFVFFALAAAVLAIFELTRALQTAGRRVDIVAQIISGATLVVAGYFVPPGQHWIALSAGIALVVVWRLLAQMLASDSRSYFDVGQDLLAGAFVQLYVPFLASLGMALLANPGGEWWVISFIAIAVAADTGAYVSGLTWGRHPMAPRISPKKTWEGLAGAAVVAVTAGVLLAVFALQLPAWAGAILGAVILLTATLGDLGESMMKRDLGIKDMSSWLPGHGGVLDRLDSILPSAMAALILYTLLTPLASS